MKIHTVVVGTAGHIDHGKSSLVRALTGIDPDRWQEEKERGMTIDLGFAPWSLPDGRRIGLVDVPGHERFIKNMVAGATGIDMVVLVVAADDGVMPQTREHLDIMSILGIPRGVIALSKIDLVDPELIELAIEDVREFVAGTFLEGAPILPVSTHTGEGLDELRRVLSETVAGLEPRRPEGPFRMPIQRVFSASGFGTIVTGIPVSGVLAKGDRAEILPGAQSGRVRGLQAYRETVDEVRAGHSSAVNLSDVDYRQVTRGMVLAAPGSYRSTSFFEGTLELGAHAARAVEHLCEVRVHVGTAEVLGQLALLEGDELNPGSSSFVQLRLREEVCVAPGDRFLLRLASPMVVLGGGVVVRLSDRRLKRSKPGVLEGLQRARAALDDPLQALAIALADAPRGTIPAGSLGRELGWTESETVARLRDLAARGEADEVAGSWISVPAAEVVAQDLRRALEAFYRRQPGRLWMDLSVLRAGTRRASGARLEAILAWMEQRGETVRRGAQVRSSERRLDLTPEQSERCSGLRTALLEAPFTPPTPAELAAHLGVPEAQVQADLDTLQDLGEACRIQPDLVLAQSAIESAAEAIRANIRRHGELEIPALRDELGTSRKFLLPILDHFDRTGLTLRQGGRRILKEA